MLISLVYLIGFTGLDNDVMLLRRAPQKTCHFAKLFGFPGKLTATAALVSFQSFVWAATESVNNKETAELDDVVLVAEEAEEVVLEQSAAAVDVINLVTDQKLTADLSEVLSREPGISIRRMGGLGSRERFSLNGLRDEQIRFFIDGIPLEMSGYTFGVGTIPVNLIRRADIYHGVVPIKFGADALGGAVNLITEKGRDGTGGSISHMTGDFGTSRSTVNLKYVDGDSGFFSRLNGFYDYSDNNYTVDVTIPNRLGQIVPYKAKRFHNAFEGQGANVDLGYTGKKWADLIQLSLYTSKYYSEIQHNATMSKVYGEPTIERNTYGANLRYEQQFLDELSLEITSGVSELKSEFIDVADYSYLWDGREVVTAAPHPGEIGDPCDCTTWKTSQFSIVHVQWDFARDQLLEFSTAPTWNQQTGRNHHIKDADADPINSDRDMFSLVSGVNYTLNSFSGKLQNQIFVKHYSQERESDQQGASNKLKSSVDRTGWGSAIRYRIYDWLFAKASYEQATRLPGFNEVFGDSETIIPNLDLNEEYTNNYNLSLKASDLVTDYGSWNGEVNFFLRDIEEAIMLMTVNDVSQYENIGAVESEGVQMSVSWSSPEDFLDVTANYTNFEFINTADTGLFARFKNQQVPNRPHTFFNTKISLKWLGVFSGYDEFSLRWNYRYVDKFELIWKGQGLEEFKPSVAAQESHTLGATYSKDFFPYVASLTAEVQNLTDEKLFDYYGVQRPGRAFFVKAVLEF